MNYYLQPRVKYADYSERSGYPIYLRFSYCGEEAFLFTNIYIQKKEHWNDKLKMIVDGPYFKTKNKVIEKMREDADERLRQAILSGEGPSVKAFKGTQLDSLEAYIRQVDKSSLAQGLIKQMKGFGDDKVPRIESITVKWLRQFDDYIEGVAGKAYNTKVNYIASLRKVLNQAVKEGYITKSPIGKGLYEAPAPGETEPVYLIDQERETLLEGALNPKGDLAPEVYRTLVYFMLGSYTGLRFSDWEAFDYDSQVRGGKLNLRAIKNKSLINRTIEPGSTLEKLLNVIKKIGPLNNKYWLVLNHLEEIQAHFKITQELKTHVARHSFGYLCASLGIPKQVTAYLMGITAKTVEIYYHLTGTHIEAQSKNLASL